MAFSFDEAEYHTICNKIYERAVRFVNNNLPEALETNDVSTLLDIYIKVSRARAHMVEDILASTQDYQRLVSSVLMLKHFLNINECYEDQKVAYDFNHKQLVFLDEGEQRPYDMVGDEGDYQSELSSDEESFSDIDEPSEDDDEESDIDEGSSLGNSHDHTDGDFF